jgi:transposase
MESEIQPQRSRRKHSPEFKAEVIQACRQPGVSIRSIALTRGLNPSLVRHWLGSRGTGAGLNVARPAPPAAQPPSGFLAVQIENRQTAAAVRLEIRRDSAVVIVEWPAQEAAACGAWLREWLR